MLDVSKEVVALIQYLVPGFIVAWAYFGLTSHVKPSQFERLVQAIIFTVVVQAIVTGEKWLFLWAGHFVVLGVWTGTSELVASLLTALGLGIAVSGLVNADIAHRFVRRIGISTRTGHPCEWFGIFAQYQRYIVLQMKDGSRLYGWPSVWPSEAEKGHFFLTDVLRTANGEDQELNALEGILVDVKDVSSVEFVKFPESTK